MIGVLEGFGVIAIVIAAGFALAHLGLVGRTTQDALAVILFYIAMPALMIELLSGSDLGGALGLAFAVSISSVAVVLVCYGLYARLLRRQPLGRAVIGCLCASYVNAGNLGLPIAVYVLGDPSVVVPVMMMQLIAYAPVMLGVLASSSNGSATSVKHLAAGLRNPIALGALVGLCLAYTGVDLPEVVAEPIALVAGMAIPGALLAYGISLRVEARFGSAGRGDVAVIGLLKLVVQPTAAYLFGRFVFGLEGHTLFGLTVMAALPTAQAIFVYAIRYRESVQLARDSITVTTVMSLPVIVLITVLLD